MRRRTRGLIFGSAVVWALLLALGSGCPRDQGPGEGPARPGADAGPATGDGGTATGDGGAAADGGTALASARPLAAFGSQGELTQFVDGLAKQLEAQRLSRRRVGGAMESSAAAPTKSAAPPAPPSAEPGAAAADSEDGAAGGEESITNVQEEGVDEGGIIKVHGDHLVVLRRGRLFTVSLAGGGMRPISMVDAFPPGSPGRGWYDEMLISGNTIVVVGYSYGARATELGLFNIDSEGVLTHRKTYYLRSNDYYSSRNYASRLIGDRLIFYMPYRMLQRGMAHGQPTFHIEMPAMRQWTAETGDDDWNDVIQATSIYRPVQHVPQPVLHTVVTCDLSSPTMSCSAEGILGPGGRTFYVSGSAVYIWLHGGRSRPVGQGDEAPPARGVVYRMPLRGGAPGAMWVQGTPIDQFSFKEGQDEQLNVLVRAQGGGDGMWGPEVTSGDMALLRVPLSDISTSVGVARADQYTALPRAGGYNLQNRFVGDHLLYGSPGGHGRHGAPTDANRVYVHPYRTGGTTTTVALPHVVDRIEVMGSAAVVVGRSGSDLHFSAIALDGEPRIAGLHVQPNAAQGESRSHGFFYRPTSATEGMLGLPIRSSGGSRHASLRHGSASVLFLRVRDFTFTRLGALASSGEPVQDRCVASCADWYGNARPIFLRGRIFALLGYELVEGRLAGDTLSLAGRTNFFREQPSRAPAQ